MKWEKISISVPLRPTQALYKLAQDRTRASVVRGMRLSASAMGWTTREPCGLRRPMSEDCWLRRCQVVQSGRDLPTLRRVELPPSSRQSIPLHWGRRCYYHYRKLVNFYQTTRCHIPERGDVHSHSCQNLRVRNISVVCCWSNYFGPQRGRTAPGGERFDDAVSSPHISVTYCDVSILKPSGYYTYRQV